MREVSYRSDGVWATASLRWSSSVTYSASLLAETAFICIQINSEIRSRWATYHLSIFIIKIHKLHSIWIKNAHLRVTPAFYMPPRASDLKEWGGWIGYRNSSRAWRLNGDNSSVLMLWTLVNDYYRWKRRWLTTFPKDKHIKFRSQQVGVWETGRVCPQTPLACFPCTRIFPVHSGSTLVSVLRNVPSPGFLCSQRHAFPPIRMLIPSSRCLRTLWWVKWKRDTDAHIYPLSSIGNTRNFSSESFKGSFPGGQAAKTLLSQRRGPGFSPCSGLEPTGHS